MTHRPDRDLHTRAPARPDGGCRRAVRLGWLDALRGVAVLAAIPIAARGILLPRDARYDPLVAGPLDTASWIGWAIPELVFDHTALLLVATAFGASAAAARGGDADPGWTRRYRARLALLAFAGLAHATLLWPGDVLLPLALTALLLAGVVRDRESSAAGTAAVAAAAALVAPLLNTLDLKAILDGYASAGIDPADAYLLSTPDYRAWESGLYGGRFTASLEVKWQQWIDRITRDYAYTTLWQIAAGMLAGIWWYRHGRHAPLPRATAPLLAGCGLLVTAIALSGAARSNFDPLALVVNEQVTYAGALLLAAAAVVAFTHAEPHAWTTTAGQWLRACGRSSLTIYVGSTAALAFVAQGWGFGMHGRLNHHEVLSLVVIVTAAAAAAGWLRMRRFDAAPPIESSWRIGTRLLSGGRARPERSAPRPPGPNGGGPPANEGEELRPRRLAPVKLPRARKGARAPRPVHGRRLIDSRVTAPSGRRDPRSSRCRTTTGNRASRSPPPPASPAKSSVSTLGPSRRSGSARDRNGLRKTRLAAGFSTTMPAARSAGAAARCCARKPHASGGHCAVRWVPPAGGDPPPEGPRPTRPHARVGHPLTRTGNRRRTTLLPRPGGTGRRPREAEPRAPRGPASGASGRQETRIGKTFPQGRGATAMSSLLADAIAGQSDPSGMKPQRTGIEQTAGRLGIKAAIAVFAMVATAIGATTAGGLWISTGSLQAQAEEAGRQAALTAATGFRALEVPSAANIARTLDIVLDDQLRALAAATAMLVQAAEANGEDSRYIENALRGITARTPIRRIDVSARNGATYSTEPRGLQVNDLEAEFQRLANSRPDGRTETAPATQTESGLTKAAAAQATHRRLAVRIEQELETSTAQRTYGQTNNRAAQEMAEQQTAAVGLIIAHALELAEDAGRGGDSIRRRLGAIVRNTTIEHIEALGVDGPPVYEAVSPSAQLGERTPEQWHQIGTVVRARAETTATLEGRYNPERRWVATTAVNRGVGRLTVIIALATKAGEGSLVETAWQAEADRLAAVEGISGVWVAVFNDQASRLAAAAPRPGTGREDQTDAWTRWDRRLEDMARRGALSEVPVSHADMPILSRSDAVVVSTAPTSRPGSRRRVVVVTETRGEQIVQQLRAGMTIGLVTALVLMLIVAGTTIWAARRWLTDPVERIAESAQSLAAGIQPAPVDERILARQDEIGTLGRTFHSMTEQVLARHDELQTLITERTSWLRNANERLNATQDRIAKDVALAKIVQQNMVPTGTRNDHNLELCSRMTPARELGGDFVAVHERPDGTLLIALCDVSGKGVAAALFMVCAQGALDSAGDRQNIRSIVTETNRRLCDGNELGMFVTGMIGIIDPRNGRLEYVCAGHEPAMIIDANGKLSRLKSTNGIPLGLELEEAFSSRVHRMKPGETLVMYSDGVTDACNPNEETFGEQRLEGLMTDAHVKTPEEIVQTIWTGTDLFAGPAAASDDKTCMVVRRLARAQAVTATAA